MFEEERLTLPPEKTYLLHTKGNRPIRCVQLPEASPVNKRRHYDEVRRGRGWEHRKDACGGYNCFGLVFANRRAAFFDESISGTDVIRQILSDDGYRRIPEGWLAVGDIVLFRDSRDGHTHAGLVTSKDLSGVISTVKLLSKWTPEFGEDVHNLHDHLWRDADPAPVLECWTDRSSSVEITDARR